MKTKLPNGIIIDPDGGWAKSLTDYAKQKGLSRIHGFLAEHPDGHKAYILVEYPEDDGEGRVIHETTSFEDASVHIEMLWAAENMP